jgi:hypothetical protein
MTRCSPIKYAKQVFSAELELSEARRYRASAAFFDDQTFPIRHLNTNPETMCLMVMLIFPFPVRLSCNRSVCLKYPNRLRRAAKR